VPDSSISSVKTVIYRRLSRIELKNVISRLIAAVRSFLQRMYITVQLYLENGLANHAAACAYGFLLSMTPMLLLIAFVMFFIYKSSPGTVTAMIGTIPFLGSIFDEQWLSSDLFSFSSPGIPGIISVLSIIWAGRILAMSIHRGLKNVFPTGKKRNPVKNAGVILAIEVSVIIFVLVVIISSRTAMRFYGLFEFFPQGSIVRLVTSHFGGQVFTVILLGLGAFFVYLSVPLKPPRKFSAFQGALFCTFAYFCTVMVLGIILNKARYNFLYGTFGNLIIILVNVYFFFTFFFIGAQLAFVADHFDALLFSRIRKIKIKASRKSIEIGFFKKLKPYYLLNNFFNPSKSNLNKYLRHYKKDEVIFSHGDIVDDIFYLLDGEVEMMISSSHGKESFSGIVKADSFFGEMNNLLSEDRIVTVRAKTDISVFAITSSLLDIIIKHDTSLDRKLIEHMSRKFKRTDEIAS